MAKIPKQFDPNEDRRSSVRIYVNPLEKAKVGNALLSINQHILDTAGDEEAIEQALDQLAAMWRARALDHIREEGTFKAISDVCRVIILGLPSATKGKRPVREGGEES